MLAMAISYILALTFIFHTEHCIVLITNTIVTLGT